MGCQSGNHLFCHHGVRIVDIHGHFDVGTGTLAHGGEGFGDLVDAGTIERFLGVEARIGVTYLDRLVYEGYLVRDGDWFTLSDFGLEQGAREFTEAFADLTRPTHGECSEDCWCHASADEAEACAAQRAGHSHG